MPREQHYLLPIEAIVEAMRELPDIVSLQAQLPSVPNVTRESCVAEIILGRGKLYTCTITTRTGRSLLKQNEAFSALQQMGDLEWSMHPAALPNEFLPAQERTLPQQMSPRTNPPQLSPRTNPPFNEISPLQERPFPRQLGPPRGMSNLPLRTIAALSPAQMQMLPPAYKRVFALSDGTKTVEYIARLLAKSPQEVQQILYDLQTMRLIQ